MGDIWPCPHTQGPGPLPTGAPAGAGTAGAHREAPSTGSALVAQWLEFPAFTATAGFSPWSGNSRQPRGQKTPSACWCCSRGGEAVLEAGTRSLIPEGRVGGPSQCSSGMHGPSRLPDQDCQSEFPKLFKVSLSDKIL